MNKEIQTTNRFAARNAVFQNQTDEAQNSRLITSQKLGFAIAALASLALAGGCCTRGEKQAQYAPVQTVAVEPAPPPPAPAEPAPVQAGIVVPLHQESFTVQKREVDAGTVRIRKIVKTETVNQPVELRHEEIVIERGPGSGETKSITEAFQDGETVVQLKREEAVIQKQMAPSGSIVVRSRWTTEQTNVQAELRREDIDLAQLSNTPNVFISQNVSAGTPSTAVGAATTPGGQSTGAATSSYIITDPASLPTGSAAAFVGRSVYFKGVKCTRVVDDHAIQVGTDDGRRMYILSDDTISNVKPGDSVAITGTVREAGSSAVAEKKGATYLMAQPFYIQAKKVELAQ